MMKFSKKIKNKKGVATVEFVMSLFLFITIFSFAFDLFLIGYRQFTVSVQANKIIRALSTQGGVLPSTPNNFPGGSGNYLTNAELYNILDNKFDNIGIDDFKVKVIVEDKSLPSGERSILLPSAVGLKADYRNFIKIEIDYNYTWGLWSQFIPGTQKGVMNVSRSGFSEYKYDYDKWEGEK